VGEAIRKSSPEDGVASRNQHDLTGDKLDGPRWTVDFPDPGVKAYLNGKYDEDTVWRVTAYAADAPFIDCSTRDARYHYSKRFGSSQASLSLV